jgi:GNAT superfamily N-acetyltransferase
MNINMTRKSDPISRFIFKDFVSFKLYIWVRVFETHHWKFHHFVAIDEEENGKIVGVLAASVTKEGETEKLLHDAETSKNKKWSDIQQLSALIEMKANVLARYNIDKAFHGHAMAVDKNYRGFNIGQELTMFCCKFAAKLKFPLVYGDCTSVYSVKIAKNLGQLR